MISFLNKLRRRANKRGYTIQELLIVMIIIAILFAAGFIGRSIYIERAKMTTLRSDFNNFEYAIQQALLENPLLAMPNKLPGDGDAESKQLAVLNKYLAEEIKFGATSSEGGAASTAPSGRYSCTKSDPWDMPFELYISTENNSHTGDFDETTATIKNDPNDAEFRVFIVSCAKNNKTGGEKTTIDADDCVLLIQLVNGEVKTATYNLDKEKGAFTFASDTAKTTLTGAYTK